MDILKWPVSITNWIILSDLLQQCPLYDLYNKIFEDYLIYLPLYKVYDILQDGQQYLTETEFQDVIENLWRQVAARCARETNASAFDSWGDTTKIELGGRL